MEDMNEMEDIYEHITQDNMTHSSDAFTRSCAHDMES